MRWFRQTHVLLALLLSGPATGCVAFHSTHPVEMVLSDTASAKPVANQMVILSYTHHQFQGAPGPITTSTDEHGTVTLPIADVDFSMTLQVGRAVFSLSQDIVRTGGVLHYRDAEVNMSLRVIPRQPTAIQRLFGFSFYGTTDML